MKQFLVAVLAMSCLTAGVLGFVIPIPGTAPPNSPPPSFLQGGGLLGTGIGLAQRQLTADARLAAAQGLLSSYPPQYSRESAFTITSSTGRPLSWTDNNNLSNELPVQFLGMQRGTPLSLAAQLALARSRELVPPRILF